MELQPNPGPIGLPRMQKKNVNLAPAEGDRLHWLTRPPQEEMQKECQKVVAAVTSLGGWSSGPMSLSQGDSEERTDFDSESTASAHSSVVLTVVPPGTADELI
ncbi:hypothetical protein NDU88_012607 [Pleurodeles waltl]|uniref:Uncharacterized protein n=1 Tax=Pleurodeles waltl TaxID=8319 RepID=A0AAV7R6L4_PLEWA|nr:hypothetical protein NDU88_012607 [Pleurodeles waltl]